MTKPKVPKQLDAVADIVLAYRESSGCACRICGAEPCQDCSTTTTNPNQGGDAMRRTTTLAALLALLGAGPANAQQLRLDLKPTLTFTTAATLDLATTVLGVEYGSCEGERNPRYWGPGNNWREPRYDLMARDTAILTGASAGLQYLTHRMRRAHPEHRLLRVADYAVKGFVYGVAAARGYAAARNVVRCTR